MISHYTYVTLVKATFKGRVHQYISISLSGTTDMPCKVNPDHAGPLQRASDPPTGHSPNPRHHDCLTLPGLQISLHHHPDLHLVDTAPERQLKGLKEAAGITALCHTGLMPSMLQQLRSWVPRPSCSAWASRQACGALLAPPSAHAVCRQTRHAVFGLVQPK